MARPLDRALDLRLEQRLVSFRQVLQGFKAVADQAPCLKTFYRSEPTRLRLGKRLRKKAESPTDTNLFATAALARGAETSQSTASEASSEETTLHASVAQCTHATWNAALEPPTAAPLAKRPTSDTNVRKLGARHADVLLATQGRLRLPL